MPMTSISSQNAIASDQRTMRSVGHLTGLPARVLTASWRHARKQCPSYHSHRADHVRIVRISFSEMIEPQPGGAFRGEVPLDDESGYETREPIAVGQCVIGGVENRNWRLPDVPELRRIYAHAFSHVQAFMVWALGTGAWPEAVLELHSRQINFEDGLVHLNPPGREQVAQKISSGGEAARRAVGDLRGLGGVIRRTAGQASKTGCGGLVTERG